MVKSVKQEALSKHLEKLRGEIVMRLGYVAAESTRRTTAFAVELDPPATQSNINSAEDTLRSDYQRSGIDVELHPLEETPATKVNVVLVHLKNQ